MLKVCSGGATLTTKFLKSKNPDADAPPEEYRSRVFIFWQIFSEIICILEIYVYMQFELHKHIDFDQTGDINMLVS